jgi:hypothetical protein
VKTETKSAFRQILFVLAIGLAAYCVYAIFRAFRNGERAIFGLIKAPFTAAGEVAAAIKNLFSAGPALATPQPAPITNSAGDVIATVDPNSPLYGMFAPADQGYTQALANYLLGDQAVAPASNFDWQNYNP